MFGEGGEYRRGGFLETSGGGGVRGFLKQPGGKHSSRQ